MDVAQAAADRRGASSMLKEVTDALQAASMGPAALPLAFLLGLVSAVASACCTLPAMGVLVAYSGTRQDTNRRGALSPQSGSWSGPRWH